MNIDNIISEQINKLVEKTIRESTADTERRRGFNIRKTEYAQSHGGKERSSMRNRAMGILKNDAVNNAELARTMKEIDPSIKVDSSRLTKIKNHAKGASGGHFDLDKRMADDITKAGNQLGITI